MIAVLGPGAMIRIRVGFAASTRCEVDLQHLYLGHVAVEATLLGLVLGATLSVSLGLFTVALCHYLGVARLMLALSSTEPSSYTWMYPAFAKAIWLRANGGTAGTSVFASESMEVLG